MGQVIWRDIAGYPGYQISDTGEVKSLERTIIRSDGQRKRVRERILRPRINNMGYKYVNLLCGGKATSKTVHKLVAIAFISNDNNKPCIDHVNGIRTDNRAENLRWCSYKENQNFPIAVKRREKNLVPVEQWALDGTLVNTFPSIATAEREMGVSHCNIVACCNNRRKIAGGFVWRYTSSKRNRQ